MPWLHYNPNTGKVCSLSFTYYIISYFESLEIGDRDWLLHFDVLNAIHLAPLDVRFFQYFSTITNAKRTKGAEGEWLIKPKYKKRKRSKRRGKWVEEKGRRGHKNEEWKKQ